jgi:uncharacterized protein Veg
MAETDHLGKKLKVTKNKKRKKDTDHLGLIFIGSF